MKQKISGTVTVNIFGEQYHLKGVKDQEYLSELSGYFDKKMDEVARNTQLSSSNKIAILAALNVCDDFFRFRRQTEARREKLGKKIDSLIALIDDRLKPAR